MGYITNCYHPLLQRPNAQRVNGVNGQMLGECRALLVISGPGGGEYLGFAWRTVSGWLKVWP